MPRHSHTPLHKAVVIVWCYVFLFCMHVTSPINTISLLKPSDCFLLFINTIINTIQAKLCSYSVISSCFDNPINTYSIYQYHAVMDEVVAASCYSNYTHYFMCYIWPCRAVPSCFDNKNTISCVIYGRAAVL